MAVNQILNHTFLVCINLKLILKIIILTGNQGPGWQEQQMSIRTTINAYFAIIIQAYRGNGERGDIALDDIKITEGSKCLQDDEGK